MCFRKDIGSLEDVHKRAAKMKRRLEGKIYGEELHMFSLEKTAGRHDDAFKYIKGCRVENGAGLICALFFFVLLLEVLYFP